jgi:hypothetical protein
MKPTKVTESINDIPQARCAGESTPVNMRRIRKAAACQRSRTGHEEGAA